ncbi:MAG: hypothetical protein RRY34_06765, partial [Victivallaceae bacterium]
MADISVTSGTLVVNKEGTATLINADFTGNGSLLVEGALDVGLSEHVGNISFNTNQVSNDPEIDNPASLVIGTEGVFSLNSGTEFTMRNSSYMQILRDDVKFVGAFNAYHATINLLGSASANYAARHQIGGAMNLNYSTLNMTGFTSLGGAIIGDDLVLGKLVINNYSAVEFSGENAIDNVLGSITVNYGSVLVSYQNINLNYLLPDGFNSSCVLKVSEGSRMYMAGESFLTLGDNLIGDYGKNNVFRGVSVNLDDDSGLYLQENSSLVYNVDVTDVVGENNIFAVS